MGSLCRPRAGGGVLAHLGLAALKGKFKHKLHELWPAFQAGDASLDRFLPVIASLDRFDRIRYPDEMLGKGLQLLIDVQVPLSDVPPSSPSPGTLYHFHVQEIDDLVKAIFDKASVNPRFFTESLNGEAREALERSPKAEII
jgi:hypothetical protein